MKRNLFIILIIPAIIAVQLFVPCPSVDAAKKTSSLEEEEIKRVEENIDFLNKKIHTLSLFSPEDSQKLVDIKTKLNSIADGNLKDPMYAELFYDAAFILKEREYKQDAIQYFSVVTRNFPETMYSKRALSELRKLGVKIEKEEEESDR